MRRVPRILNKPAPSVVQRSCFGRLRAEKCLNSVKIYRHRPAAATAALPMDFIFLIKINENKMNSFNN